MSDPRKRRDELAFDDLSKVVGGACKHKGITCQTQRVKAGETLAMILKCLELFL